MARRACLVMMPGHDAIHAVQELLIGRRVLSLVVKASQTRRNR